MPPTDGRDPRSNRLLQTLAPAEYAALERHLQVMSFALKQSLYAPNTAITTVYFPLTGVLDLVKLLQDGETISIAAIGKEGFIGHAVVLGVDRMPEEVLCKLPSTCAAIDVERFREHLAGHGGWSRCLLRYTAALFNDVAQSAACNRLHSVEKRVARYLLIEQDRAETNEFPMTHEFLAEMLGVRRATITETLGVLEQAGLVRTSRGRIAIADRAGLEARACECYRVMREEYAQVLGV
jgi:CRP-like cAMP-binding protein